MRKEMEATVALGSTFKHGGYEVRTEVLSSIRYSTPGSKSMHESSHAVINPPNVRLMTKHPDANSEARVEPYFFDARMAAGSIADGHSGTGHDMMLVHFLGNPAIDIPAARSILSQRRDEQLALASATEAHGTLYNGEVMAVMSEVSNGKPVGITEFLPDGEKRERVERIKWNAGEIRLLYREPEGVAELPKKRSEKRSNVEVRPEEHSEFKMAA
jgi:hypothetical protein